MCDCGTWLFNGKHLEKRHTSLLKLLIATTVAHSMKLGLKGEGDKTKLSGDKRGGSTPMVEGQFASEVLQAAISVQEGMAANMQR